MQPAPILTEADLPPRLASRVGAEAEAARAAEQYARSRLDRLRVDVARERAALRRESEEALAGIARDFDSARVRALGEASQTRSLIGGQFASARAQASLLFETAQSTLTGLLAQRREAATAAEDSQLGRLRESSARTAAGLPSSARRYDAEARVIGEAEATRATTTSDGLARDAEAYARARAAAATGDEEVREAKQRQLPPLGVEAAARIREVGAEAAERARELAGDAQGAFGERAQELRGQVQDTANRAVADLPRLGTAFRERLGQFETIALPQLFEGQGQIAAALDSAEARALEEVEAAERTFLARLEEGRAQAVEAVGDQVRANDTQMLEALSVAARRLSDGPVDPGEADAVTRAVGEAVQARGSGLSVGLRHALGEMDRGVAGAEGAFATGMRSQPTATAGQISELLGSLDAGLRNTVAGFDDLIADEFAGFETTLSGTVTTTIGQLEEIGTGMEASVDQSLSQLRQETGGAVEEGLAQNRQEASNFPGQVRQAEQRIEADARRGFWAKVWDAIVEIVSSVLFWVGIAFLAVVILIGVIFSAKVALIIGLIALVVFGVYGIYVRLRSLYEEGAPWYNWVIYLVALPLIAPLDALGLTGLIEGAVGYDIVTWRKLSEDEAAHRLAGGIVSGVLLLVTWGISKAVPMRGAVPRGGGRGAPPGEPPRLPPGPEPPRHLPAGPEPPRQLPPGPEPPRQLPPGPEPPRQLPPGPEPPRQLPPGPEPPRQLPRGPEPPRQLPPGPEPPRQLPPGPEPPRVPPSEPPPQPAPGEPPPRPAPEQPTPEPQPPEPPGPRTPGRLPRSWAKFKQSLNEAFRARLRQFRGNDALEANHSGGEGRIFRSDSNPLLALKRWFESRLGDMAESLRLLRETRSAVEADPRLQADIDVVRIHEQGPDWILRDFDPSTRPLSDFSGDAAASAARSRAIAALEGTDNAVLRNLLRKLVREPPSENVHWSPSRGKIVVIDMQ